MVSKVPKNIYAFDYLFYIWLKIVPDIKSGFFVIKKTPF